MRCLPADHLSRPERVRQAVNSLEKGWHWLRARTLSDGNLYRSILHALLPRIHQHQARLAELDPAQLRVQRDFLRQRLLRDGLRIGLALEAFALVREVTRRELGMAHHDVQLLGGLVMLRGHIAEMQTGEGKTLTAVLPAATAALAGIPVHVVTVNDYLAARDAQAMGPVYRALGLSVDTVVQGVSPAARREAYLCDVVYCTNKDLVFDYLRDSLALRAWRDPLQAHAARLRGELSAQQLLLRGLHFAIVDEADSVMLDEARTPLVLSGASQIEALELSVLDEALALASRFVEGRHFFRRDGQLQLSERGRRLLNQHADTLLAREGKQSIWHGRARREWLLQQALLARYYFQRDRHYLVRDGKVLIIDENTGRVMPDRSWEKGLQQMIERLEDCLPSTPNLTLAKMTYQRFFSRYHLLAGMTGTGQEVKDEFWYLYRRRVIVIPPHQPNRRRHLGISCVASQEEKWQRVAERAMYCAAAGQPVLIATVTLGDAEQVSECLRELGMGHAVLSARQDSEEAEVIAEAGKAGAITVATSMAGRGTDIALDAAARAAGGLHVILAGHHDAARIDRQIAGRSARQGDPGSVEIIVAEDDPLLGELPPWQTRWGDLPARMRRAQQRRERRFARERARLLEEDWRESEMLGFSGKTE